MKHLILASLLVLGLSSSDAVFAKTKKAPAKKTTKESKVAPKELVIEDVVVGTGAEAVSGKTVQVHYTGWLWKDGEKGKKFDSSVDRGDKFEFPLGAGRVIKGWDEGVKGMKIGGKRKLVIPPGMAYGNRAMGSDIPANSTLIFDVELFGVK